MKTKNHICFIGLVLVAVAACGQSSSTTEGQGEKASSSSTVGDEAGGDDLAGRAPIVAGRGELRLPGPDEPGDGETHVRHPWQRPQEATNVVARIHWQDTSWGDIEFAIGSGICPHRGRKVADVLDRDGEAEVRYSNPEMDPDASTTWFLHVDADRAKGVVEWSFSSPTTARSPSSCFLRKLQ